MGKRRSSVAKVSQRQRDPRKVAFKQAQVQKAWNKNKTVYENYADLGLKYSVNSMCGTRKFTRKINSWQSQNTADILSTDFEREDSDIFNEIKQLISDEESESKDIEDNTILKLLDESTRTKQKSRPKKSLSAYYTNLREKYGDNYKVKICFLILENGAGYRFELQSIIRRAA